MLEYFAAVNKDYRYILPVLGFPTGVILDVYFNQTKRKARGDIQDRFLGLVA